MGKNRPIRRQIVMEQLGRLWDAGIESGPPSDGEAAFARIKDRLKANLADRPAERASSFKRGCIPLT